MVQRIYRQISESSLGDVCSSITVTANAIQQEQLRMQLGSAVDLVIEPARRDTYLAIALAASYLREEKGVREDEVVVVLPVDSFVDTHYFDRIRLIGQAFAQHDADLILVGAKPLHATEKYGYVVPVSGECLDGAPGEATHGAAQISLKVANFREKPSVADAADLIRNGALWNCGVFGFRLGYLMDVVRRDFGRTQGIHSFLMRNFEDLQRRSFDYEVVEHAQNIRVVEYQGSWKDLGTWETFTEEIEAQTMGKVCLDGETAGTHVLNELGIPVVAMDVKDIVIAANHEGILVAPKGKTYKLKDAVSHLNGRPMQEEKRWGKYIVLDWGSYGDIEALTKKLTLNPGSKISYQSHVHRKEIWTILSGEGLLYLNDEKRQVGVGDTIRIEANDRHAIQAITKLEIIEVQLGCPLVEEDIIRIEVDW
jgi:mannose-1-phosphate guanylyltransferase